MKEQSRHEVMEETSYDLMNMMSMICHHLEILGDDLPELISSLRLRLVYEAVAGGLGMASDFSTSRRSLVVSASRDYHIAHAIARTEHVRGHHLAFHTKRKYVGRCHGRSVFDAAVAISKIKPSCLRGNRALTRTPFLTALEKLSRPPLSTAGGIAQNKQVILIILPQPQASMTSTGKDRRVGHCSCSPTLVVFLTRGFVVGLVSEFVKLASNNRLHIVFVLARLYCFDRLRDVLFLFFLFVFLLRLPSRLRSSAHSAVFRTWNSDSFGFERLLNFGQLFDECSELFDVKGNSLEESRISTESVCQIIREIQTHLFARKHLLVLLVKLADIH